MALNFCKPLLVILLFIILILFSNFKLYNNLKPSPYNQIAIRNNNNNKVSIIYDSLYITKQLNITLKYKINNNNKNNNSNNNSNHTIIPHYFNKNQPISLLLAKDIIYNNTNCIYSSFPCYTLEFRDAVLMELNNLNINVYQRVEIFIDIQDFYGLNILSNKFNYINMSTSHLLKNIYIFIIRLYIDFKIAATNVETINNCLNSISNYSVSNKGKGLIFYFYLMCITDAIKYRIIFE